MQIKTLLFIGLGSGIGGMARYIIAVLLQNKSVFPLGTISVNLSGCFFIGVVYGLMERTTISSEMRLFLATGILGGFTTFSAFSMETVALLKNEHYGIAFANIGISLLGGMGATFLGFLLIKSW